MNGILTRIGDALAILRNQPRDRHIIQEIPVQERPINDNNNHENEVNRKSHVPHANVSSNKWFLPRNKGSNSSFKAFGVNDLMIRRGGTTAGSKKEYYEYQNPPWVNRNMSKTQWRRHQRMKRDAILGMQQNNGVRPLVLNRITEGLPPGFEKKRLRKEQEDKEVIIDCFEYSFEDSLEAICGVISILPADYAEDYQNEHMLRDCAREDYLDDPFLSPKVV
ncbi:hypothetical protein JHK86_027948 [Glycine max]|nr:hypothetical protein JHK86_027948 [Glycine max]